MMKFLLPFVILSCLATGAMAELPERWRQCGVDEDCSVIHGTCGGWLTVATSHKAEARKQVSNEAMIVRCAEGQFGRPKATCSESLCVGIGADPDGETAWNLSDLNRGVGAAHYLVDAWVVFVSKCPPCPEGAVCESCLGPHVMLSDHSKSSGLDGSRHSEHELIAFVRHSEALELGRRYRLTLGLTRPIRFTGSVMDSYAAGVEIVASEPLASE